jgi:hypothetical protein
LDDEGECIAGVEEKDEEGKSARGYMSVDHLPVTLQPEKQQRRDDALFANVLMVQIRSKKAYCVLRPLERAKATESGRLMFSIFFLGFSAIFLHTFESVRHTPTPTSLLSSSFPRRFCLLFGPSSETCAAVLTNVTLSKTREAGKMSRVSRLFRIIVSESAYLIWKVRKEQVVGGIHNRWVSCMNMQLKIDQLLTDRLRYGNRALDIRKVLHTWDRVLMDNKNLPDNWIWQSGF